MTKNEAYSVIADGGKIRHHTMPQHQFLTLGQMGNLYDFQDYIFANEHSPKMLDKIYDNGWETINN